MGSIATPNIQELISKFNLMNFVESGTYQGSGLRWVFENTKFKQYYSTELNEKYYNK